MQASLFLVLVFYLLVKANKGSFKWDSTIDFGENVMQKMNYVDSFQTNVSFL